MRLNEQEENIIFDQEEKHWGHSFSFKEKHMQLYLLCGNLSLVWQLDKKNKWGKFAFSEVCYWNLAILTEKAKGWSPVCPYTGLGGCGVGEWGVGDGGVQRETKINYNAMFPVENTLNFDGHTIPYSCSCCWQAIGLLFHEFFQYSFYHLLFLLFTYLSSGGFLSIVTK